ncbi:MAG TPA: methionyl-tRNA formyltransferase [Candidatus Kapabacteria bacterium]|nr:methionyl-tRNA formyltransferase [Candidatus Kapabacteria bacterium]
MNIIFMGTSDFAVQSGEALCGHEYNIVTVVTVPDKPQGRGLRMQPSPVKIWAQGRGLPLLQPENLRDAQFIEQIKSLSPDLIIVVAFRILPKEVFTLPKLGAFNLHASILPKYRGAAPIQWALINGEKETGVTTFFLQEKVDTGSIVLQEELSIGENETFGELHDRLARLGAEAVIRTVEMIGSGMAQPVKQNDMLATPAPKITKEICRIDWTKSADAIHNLVRALSPAPGAWTTLNGSVFKIFLAMPSGRKQKESKAGVCVIEKDKLFVQTGNGLLEILEAQCEGRKRATTSNLIQGRSVRDGDILI